MFETGITRWLRQLAIFDTGRKRNKRDSIWNISRYRIYAMIHARNSTSECKLEKKIQLVYLCDVKTNRRDKRVSFYNYYNDVIDECSLFGWPWSRLSSALFLSLSSIFANKPPCVHKSLKGFFNRSGLLKFQDNSWIVDEGLDLNSLNNFDYYLLRNDNKYVLVLVNQPLATCFEIPFSNISPLPPFLISWNLVALLIK